MTVLKALFPKLMDGLLAAYKKSEELVVCFGKNGVQPNRLNHNILIPKWRI